MLDRIELGICIVNASGDVMLTNRHAGEIFANPDGLWAGLDGRLRSDDPETLSTVQAAVEAVSRTAVGDNRESSVEIPVERRGTANALLVIASPLRDASMELERGLTGCLLTIVDTDRHHDLRMDAFGDAYSLTSAERRAAKLLVSGLTPPEIGEVLGVATSTAQSHIMAAFSKTHSSNRVNFVWKAVQFSPPVI